MSNWHCYTCKVAVEEQDVDTQFLENPPMEFIGLVCPNCQEIWLTEDVVMEEISQAEADAEAKMA